MKTEIKTALLEELKLAALEKQEGDFAKSWHHLERAHILSQPYAWPHTYVHILMLRSAIKSKHLHEILGQIIRLLLASPGSILKRYPKGNTGGANVSMFAPMKIPSDLATILDSEEAHRRR